MPKGLNDKADENDEEAIQRYGSLSTLQDQLTQQGDTDCHGLSKEQIGHMPMKPEASKSRIVIPNGKLGRRTKNQHPLQICRSEET